MCDPKTSRLLRTSVYRLSWLVAFGLLAMVVAVPARSCPFCSAVDRTFTEQMDSSDVVVIAELKEQPKDVDQTQLPRAVFAVTEILRGEQMIKVDHRFSAVVVSREMNLGDKFLLMGNGTDVFNWTTPLAVSDFVIGYLQKLDGLPESGGDRLAFFAQYFEHEESVLAYDAFDEFASASYDEVKEVKDRLDRQRLIGWLEDPDVLKSRKRMYYTLLGVCGTEAELPFLEDIIRSGDRDRQDGLDALIACYLTLRGDDGVALIEDTFLKDPNAEYIDVFSAISALRFHGTEADRVSKERIVQALRNVLDRPQMADMVIPDLARWEDWSVMEDLVKMFVECDSDETRWVRTPIISYLQDCPREEAKEHLVKLREIDPDAAKRADMLADLDWGDDDDDEWDDDEWGDEDEEDVPVEQPKPSEPEGSDSKESDSKGSDSKESESKGSDSKKEGDKDSVDNNVDAQTNKQTVTTLKPAVTSGRRNNQTNPSDSSYVTTDETVSTEPAAELPDLNESGQLAQRTTQPTPPAAIIVPASPATWVMVLVGLGICASLFLLLWTVLNGTFERLLF